MLLLSLCMMAFGIQAPSKAQACEPLEYERSSIQARERMQWVRSLGILQHSPPDPPCRPTGSPMPILVSLSGVGVDPQSQAESGFPRGSLGQNHP